MSILKDMILGGFSFLGLSREHAVILMYHSISDTPAYFSAVTPQTFERQMSYLATRAYPVISLAELVRRLEAHEPLGGSVVITFDDGYQDNYTMALPVLKKYGFPATVFVDTDLAGREDKRGLIRLTVAEMQELKRAGVSVQPHSRSHPRLGDIDVNRAHEEIVGSKRALEEWLGAPVEHFAYPYGSYTDDTEHIVKTNGFTAAVTVHEGTVRRDTDPYRLPRNSIDRSTTKWQFKGKLSRAADLYERIKHIS